MAWDIYFAHGKAVEEKKTQYLHTILLNREGTPRRRSTFYKRQRVKGGTWRTPESPAPSAAPRRARAASQPRNSP
ncbi:MAG: hypothetical protein DHS20C08_17070 [Rhodomicrobium sp.]|nr:MAG: hypothetical protein DHS20C08_17070 [Rhodomicrobium sp.]